MDWYRKVNPVTTTGQQRSLRTKEEAEAHTLLHSKNEAHRPPVLNVRIAQTYLTATDPEVARRTWQVPMDARFVLLE